MLFDLLSKLSQPVLPLPCNINTALKSGVIDSSQAVAHLLVCMCQNELWTL